MARSSSISSSDSSAQCRRLVLRLAGFAPLAALLVATNWFVDPANLFRPGDLEARIATIIGTGSAVAFNGNYDERMVQKLMLAPRDQAPEVLVLGSSRSMQVSSGDAASCDFYNASVSNATLYDFLSIYELIAGNGQSPRVLLINLDPFTLKRDHNVGKRDTLRDYHSRALQRLGSFVDRASEGEFVRGRWVELISPAYLQASLASLMARGKGTVDVPVRVSVEAVTAQLRFSDGSREYSSERRTRELAARRKIALAWGARPRQFRVDPDQEDLFVRFVKSVQRDGVQVVLMLFPYHPAAYPEMLQQPGSRAVEDIEASYRRLASRLDVSVVGSFRSERAGMVEEDFVDGMHATRAATQRLLSRSLPAQMFQKQCSRGT